VGSPLAGHVDRNHAATSGPQHLNRQSTDQTYTDHRHRLAERDVRLAYTLNRDGADRRQGCRLQADTTGYKDGKICRHEVEFTVARVPNAGAGHRSPG